MSQLSHYVSQLLQLGPNFINLSYVAEIPTAGSNLSSRFKELGRIQRTGGRHFNDTPNSLKFYPCFIYFNLLNQHLVTNTVKKNKLIVNQKTLKYEDIFKTQVMTLNSLMQSYCAILLNQSFSLFLVKAFALQQHQIHLDIANYYIVVFLFQSFLVLTVFVSVLAEPVKYITVESVGRGFVILAQTTRNIHSFNICNITATTL